MRRQKEDGIGSDGKRWQGKEEKVVGCGEGVKQVRAGDRERRWKMLC